MKKSKLPFGAGDEDNDSEINTVYGDLITFVMMLFVLLFVLAYNEKNDDTFFVEMRLKFGASEIKQEQVLTSESLLVSELEGYIKEEQLDEVAQILVDEQKIKLLISTSPHDIHIAGRPCWGGI